MENREAWKICLKIYHTYCRLLLPLYKRIKVDSLHVRIDDASVLPPLMFSEKLLGGDLTGKSILDVGTGCGIIALCAKRKGASYVVGVDINDSAIACAESNLKTNLEGSDGIEFMRSDLFDGVRGRFDVIVSNPPFLRITPSNKNDYMFCGGDLLERMLREGKDRLHHDGEIRILHPQTETAFLRMLASKYRYSIRYLDYKPSKDTALLRALVRFTIRPKLNVFIFKQTSESELKPRSSEEPNYPFFSSANSIAG